MPTASSVQAQSNRRARFRDDVKTILASLRGNGGSPVGVVVFYIAKYCVLSHLKVRLQERLMKRFV